MPGLITIITYLQQRFRPLPWLVLPIVLYIFAIEEVSQISIFKLVYAYLFLLSFRLFDDLMCIPYDMKNKEGRFYYQQIYKRDLVIFSIIFFVALVGSTYFTFNDSVLYLHVGFFLISLSLYRFLVMNKGILFISLFKYPLLIYCLSDGLNSGLIWAGIIFLIFILMELMDEKIIKQYKYAKQSLITMAIIGKVIHWSNL